MGWFGDWLVGWLVGGLVPVQVTAPCGRWGARPRAPWWVGLGKEAVGMRYFGLSVSSLVTIRCSLWDTEAGAPPPRAGPMWMGAATGHMFLRVMFHSCLHQASYGGGKFKHRWIASVTYDCVTFGEYLIRTDDDMTVW
ncbi:hypothetical protein BDZ91DRAFT_249823 [Kalaharituber pfeilii]|nr:hypothetical protein BDZ91DRAFT_249823 [Kalaharituber pfeilii]